MNKVITLLSILFLPLVLFAQKDYKGAEIYSTDSWKYGKVEIRMQMAKGSGILSTFFTYKNGSEMQGEFWEEIDIEVFGKDNAESLQTNIITNNPKVHSEAVHTPGFSMADDYHTYGLEWTPDYVAWYLDGVEIHRTVGEQVSDLTNPQSFRMNIWAAEWEDWVGPFDTDALPAYQFVNWIKYSSYTPGEGDNGSDFTEEWVDDFDSFNSSRWAKANWTFDGNLVEFAPENVVVKDGYLILAITEAESTGFDGVVPEDSGVTGLNDFYNDSDLQVYPNPTSSVVNIEGNYRGGWKLYNAMGVVVEEGATSIVNVQNLPDGVYFVNVDQKMLRFVKR